MISNLIVTPQKFVLFVDNVGIERLSDEIIRHWLKEQGQECIRNIPENVECNLKSSKVSDNYTKLHSKTNVILLPLSTLLVNFNAGAVFQIINKLKKNPNAKQIFLWATVKNVSEHFVIPFLEYMADMIVTFVDSSHLSILSRKTGGLISNKDYDYQLANGDLSVKEVKRIAQKLPEPTIKPESLGTFKIDLDEEELVARNALKLPYERTSDEPKESEIVYTPDADDDFDDEDPDEDLYI